LKLENRGATLEIPDGAQRNGGDACVAIVDGDGMLLWRSSAMRGRLHELGLSCSEGSRCCTALNCAGNTGSGEPRCLTHLALAESGLAPRRWRSPLDGADDDAAISAQVVRAGGGPILVFDLTFVKGRLNGGAPLLDAGREPAGDVQVRALGPLSVRIGGRTMDGDWQQQRPGEVFRYLLASRGGVARSEAIASALWPERGPAAVTNVRYCIYKVREQLDDRDLASSLILRSAGGYRLDPRRLALDVDVFQAKLTAGLTAHRAGRAQAAEAILADALDLYRGDFLADDPYAEWAFTEREYLRGLAGKALVASAQTALADGRLEVAATRLLRLAQLEPFDSQVHQMLIAVCLRRGRRTEAVRHYSALRQRLAKAFGETPDFNLANVAADIAAGSR
jgi:DNA-binding SARP family transcriptional activator